MTSAMTAAASVAYRNSCHQSNIPVTKFDIVITIIICLLTIRFAYKNWKEIKKEIGL
jgi:hypothetical protein